MAIYGKTYFPYLSLTKGTLPCVGVVGQKLHIT